MKITFIEDIELNVSINGVMQEGLKQSYKKGYTVQVDSIAVKNGYIYFGRLVGTIINEDGEFDDFTPFMVFNETESSKFSVEF